MLETFGSPWKLVGAIFGSFVSLASVRHLWDPPPFFLNILLTESLGIIRSVSVPRSGTDGQAMVRTLQTRDGRQATNRHWTDERQMADRPETDEGQTSDGRVTDDSQMAYILESREPDARQTTSRRSRRKAGDRQIPTNEKQTAERWET